MGNAFSCKQKKKKKTGESPKKPSQANNNNNRRKSKKKPKQIVLDKDRKIIQKDKELYQVVFDAEGFSVHDLALLGQKNSADTCVKQELKPKKMGRVNIIPDIIPFLTQNPAKSPKSNKKATLEESKEEFEITEILDYIDDLYLQLLDPDRTIMDDRRDSTSNTENASSK